MRIRSITGLVADARLRAAGSRTCIIGVDGPSGSGKSVLARRIARLAAAPIVEIDDFVSWQNVAGWWPRFDREVLVPLAAGRDARYRVRDWTNDEFGESLNGLKEVAWAPTVVLDGVTCTRAAAAHAVSLRLWIEAGSSVRLQRGLARDGESHRPLWVNWMRQEAEFVDVYGTRQLADVIIDGDPSLSHDPESEVVLYE